jgi:hypothetical protein
VREEERKKDEVAKVGDVKELEASRAAHAFT